jgi:hypothetical protein
MDNPKFMLIQSYNSMDNPQFMLIQSRSVLKLGQNYFTVYTKLGHNQTRSPEHNIHRKQLGLEDDVSG